MPGRGFRPRGPPLFNNVDFTLTPGWYGLVGANGAGKTTLLALIAQALAPVAGSIDWVPKSRHVAQCLQLVPLTATGALQTFAEAQDRASRIVRDRLRLDIDALQRWTSLSFGERKRWQIGAVLAQEPDVLLLDEPTNHLDAPGRNVLLSALQNFRGVGVVVSHDRALLNALTHKTLRIAQKQVSMLPASYDAAREMWLAQTQAAQNQRQHHKTEVNHMRCQLKRACELQTQTQAGRGSKQRLRHKNDSDGRTATAKKNAERADKRASSRVKTLP